MSNKNCDCTGTNYQGCLKLPNGLYACTKKDGSIDSSRKCLGEIKIGDDGVEGWTMSCNKLTYDTLKERLTNWCTKLYQDGIYDYNQYQDCLQNLDTGTVSYYKSSDEDRVDDNKDPKRIYGYYPKGREVVEDVNPNIPIIKDDFQKVTIYNQKDKGFLICKKNGKIKVLSDSDTKDELYWQLVSLSSDGIYGIRSSYYGKYLVGTDKGSVEANSDNITPWSQWKLTKHNNSFGFESVIHKKYLTFDGQKAFLKDGWTDNNLWLIDSKLEASGKYLKEFDKSDLNLQKDELLQSIDNNYRKAVNNKYMRDYYKNKLPQLKYLRDQQKKYLMDLSYKKEQELVIRKSALTKEIVDLGKKANYTTKYNRKQYDDAVNKNEIECKISEDCLNKAVQFNNDYSAGGNPFSELIRKSQIMKTQNKCNWTNTQTANIVLHRYEVPSPDYCKQLQKTEDTLKEALSMNRDEIFSIIDGKNAILRDINYQIIELQSYRNEIKDQFDILNEKEKKEIIILSDKAEKDRLINMNDYKKAEIEGNSFIESLAKSNKKLESQIGNLTTSIDTKLQINDKLESQIENTKKNIKSEDQNEVIKVNESLVESQVSTMKTEFFIATIIICITILFILYIGYKTYLKWMD